MSLLIDQPRSQADTLRVPSFQQQIQQECLQGSGIAETLFHRAITIVSDLEIGSAGEGVTTAKLSRSASSAAVR
ncbi:MAG: hypothetical protein HC805_03690 [Alkalinema sp. RL_2_19]|nr:hypothetical protein [Alkalinema sp. RL_2_19]